MSHYLRASATVRQLTATTSLWCQRRSFFSAPKEVKPYTVITTNNNIAPARAVPEPIPRPSYLLAAGPTMDMDGHHIPIRTLDEMAAMREVGRLTRQILEEAAALAQKGNITTNDIDVFVHERAIAAGAYPSTLHYSKFPKSIVSTSHRCTD